MNITRKLISAHLTKPSPMQPGDEIYLKIDQTLTHDITAVMGYLAFQRLDIPRVKTELSVSYLDHNLLYIDNRTPDDHIFLRTLGEHYGIVVSRPGNGICHALHYSRFGKPGKTLVGTDSHTTSGGALGMLAIGVGGMDAAMAMAGLPLRLRMPKVVRVNLVGKLRPGVAAKDVILEMLRRHGVKGGVGRVYEYVGEGAKTLSVPERVTITNMGAELGATSSVFPADEVVRDFLIAQKREQDYTELLPDPDATYDEEETLDLSTLEPLIACPHMPDIVSTVKEVEQKRIKVDQVFIGSCTNGSYSDIAKAAAVMKGHVVNENVSVTVAVSSRQIYKQLMKDGIIDDLLDSGVRLTELACGACTGIGQAPPTNGVSVRTSNRNFKGRGGTEDAFLYLSSPEVAAACAVLGYIAGPDAVLEDLSPLGEIKEPETYPIDDSLFIWPREDAQSVEIISGPNIKPLPVNEKPQGTIHARISLKAGDNISTDDITPANAMFSSMRSNIPAIAEYAYSRYDPEFVARCRANRPSIIIGGENYGQGSSREHAAITPMYLGVKAIVAKSFARIHKDNLINHGVLPLVFADPADYERLNLLDELVIENIEQQIPTKTIKIGMADGESFEAKLELSDDEIAILLEGGKLPWVKAALQDE